MHLIYFVAIYLKRKCTIVERYNESIGVTFQLLSCTIRDKRSMKDLINGINWFKIYIDGNGVFKYRYNE